jgi:predicted phosphodiesterase
MTKWPARPSRAQGAEEPASLPETLKTRPTSEVSTALPAPTSAPPRGVAVTLKPSPHSSHATLPATGSDALPISKPAAGDWPKRGIVLPDIHLGHHDQRVLDLVEEYAACRRWDYWICLGDLLDNGGIAPFNMNRPRKVASEVTLKQQFALGNEFLDRHLAAVRQNSPACECYLIEGNHEERIERLVDAMPQFEGLVEVEPNLELKRRKVKWVPYWSTAELVKIGKARFAHGFKTNQHHAAAMVRDYGCTLIYGHTHDVMRFPVRRMGDGSVIMGQSLGCLCDLNPPWMKGRPNNWSHAFGVLNVWPDGNFQLEVVDIFKYRFVGPGTDREYKD